MVGLLQYIYKNPSLPDSGRLENVVYRSIFWFVIFWPGVVYLISRIFHPLDGLVERVFDIITLAYIFGLPLFFLTGIILILLYSLRRNPKQAAAIFFQLLIVLMAVVVFVSNLSFGPN
jgi:hypothetical protein